MRAMANYYHEARAHAKNIRNMQDDNRRRAERRAEKAGVEAELPVNLLRIDGRSCLVTVNDEQYQAVQSMEGMIPMNGSHDNLIDRFDGRALLDFYREPVSRQAKSKTEDELELEELLAFETYRDLVKLLQQNLTEEQGLIAAELRNIEERASARSAAAAAVGIQPAQPGGFASSSAIPAGQGEFGAVGFSYDAPAESSLPSRAGGPVEDLGEEASSESDSGKCASNAHCLPAYSDCMVPRIVSKQAALKLPQLRAAVGHVAHLQTAITHIICTLH